MCPIAFQKTHHEFITPATADVGGSLPAEVAVTNMRYFAVKPLTKTMSAIGGR